MEKIVVGPSCRGVVDLEAPVAHNLNVIAKVLGRRVEDLVIIILDRPRHEKLIGEIRKAGARIRLISDGDLSPGVAAAMLGSGVHAVMGTGGAPEGVITAAAVRCLNGYMVGRLVGYTPEQGERMKDMGISDPKRIYTADELAPGKNIIFAATGVTDGPLLKGVRFFGDGVRTTSLVMKLSKGKVRFIESDSSRQASGREGQNSGAVEILGRLTAGPRVSGAFFFAKALATARLARLRACDSFGAFEHASFVATQATHHFPLASVIGGVKSNQKRTVAAGGSSPSGEALHERPYQLQDFQNTRPRKTNQSTSGKAGAIPAGIPSRSGAPEGQSSRRTRPGRGWLCR